MDIFAAITNQLDDVLGCIVHKLVVVHIVWGEPIRLPAPLPCLIGQESLGSLDDRAPVRRKTPHVRRCIDRAAVGFNAEKRVNSVNLADDGFKQLGMALLLGELAGGIGILVGKRPAVESLPVLALDNGQAGDGLLAVQRGDECRKDTDRPLHLQAKLAVNRFLLDEQFAVDGDMALATACLLYTSPSPRD